MEFLETLMFIAFDWCMFVISELVVSSMPAVLEPKIDVAQPYRIELSLSIRIKIKSSELDYKRHHVVSRRNICHSERDHF